MQPSETTPAQERGERLDTGKAIARGGREGGFVAGAEPAPTSDGASASKPRDRQHRAVAEAMSTLGTNADLTRIIQEVRRRTGLELSTERATAIRDELVRQADAPPSLDQPPPENAQMNSRHAQNGSAGIKV